MDSNRSITNHFPIHPNDFIAHHHLSFRSLNRNHGLLTLRPYLHGLYNDSFVPFTSVNTVAVGSRQITSPDHYEMELETVS